MSVAIPTYNRCDLLLETLESLRAQTCPDWEAVVVDDHSTDATVETVRERYAGDERVRIERRRGDVRGAPACRNQAARDATGEYLIFLDSDDLLAPHCVGSRLAVMRSDASLDFAVFQGSLFVERAGDLNEPWNAFGTGRADLLRFLAWDNVWQTSGPIWSRRAFERLGGWDETLACWQDSDWHLRALIAGLRYRAVDGPPDYFVRRGQVAGADNIWVNSHGPKHLDSMTRVFTKAAQALREAGSLDRATKPLLTAALLLLAGSWVEKQGDRERAAALWRTVGDLGLLNPLLVSGGGYYVKNWLRRRYRLAALFEGILRRAVPGLAVVGRSQTFCHSNGGVNRAQDVLSTANAAGGAA